MRVRPGPRLAWSGAALVCLLAVAAAGLALLNLPAFRDPELIGSFAQAVIPTLGIVIIGALIAARLPKNRMGWILLAAALVNGLGAILSQYLIHTLLVARGSLPAVEWIAWINSILGGITYPALVVMMMLFFPDGRLPSRRWHWLVWTAIIYTAANALVGILDPTPILSPGLPPVHNPTGLAIGRGLEAGPLGWLSFFGAMIIVLLAVASLVVRLRRAPAVERQQVRWVVYALGVFTVLNILLSLSSLFLPPSPEGRIIGNVVSNVLVIAGFGVALPAAIGIAILKYRLYDIDVVISRTLVFGFLAVFITAVYVGIVVGLGSLVGSQGQPNLALSILATAVVAVAFQLVRSKVQGLANRLVYGNRATPYEVLAQFSHRVGGAYATDEVLPRLAQVLGEGTGATAASVTIRIAGEPVVAATWPVGHAQLRAEDADRVGEVRHQGEILGALAVKKRPGEPATPVEEKLISDLAAQAGQVLRNVRLTSELEARLLEISTQAAELRASRQRIVAVQDTERRRLERNIHDGAQQHLVALAVKLRLASTLTRRDPGKARQSIRELEGQTAEALRTLRDLAQGIYPPVLRERGLVEALRPHARVAAQGVGRYHPEVEAGVYFCCLEALQNATKHAQASMLRIDLRQDDGHLAFAVSDDGIGFDPEAIGSGRGLQNMKDRIASLGGSLSLESTPGKGTTVSGRLPVSTPAGVLP